MIDIKRLNELHAATEPVGEYNWERAIDTAWPAVAARLAVLEEFAQRIRDAHCDENARIGWPTIEYWSQYAIEWLDAETEKAGVDGNAEGTTEDRLLV